MVKLYVLSDLHLEAAGFDPDPEVLEACDAVILAGDIYPGPEGLDWAHRNMAATGKPIIYVAGNHEFWGSDMKDTLQLLRKRARDLGIHFLENDAITVCGLKILGCTLWTDYAFFGTPSYSMNVARDSYPDMSEIRLNGDPIQPEQILQLHQRSLDWLKTELAQSDPANTVVITHHYVHQNSCPAMFCDSIYTPCFGSRLDPALIARAGLWIHGHNHTSSNFITGTSPRQSLITSNPRGYPISQGSSILGFENHWFRCDRLIDQDQRGSWKVVR